MNALVTGKLDEIRQLCLRYRVRQLDLFGSAAGPDFDPLRCDIDLLVLFDRDGPDGAFDQYFGLLEGLEALLGRPVDLVNENAIENPYFRQAVERSRVSLYAG